jgi:hypothetical protein
LLLAAVKNTNKPLPAPYPIPPKYPPLLADKTPMRKVNVARVIDANMADKNNDKLFCASLKIYELKWYPNGTTCLSSGQHTIKPAHVPPLMVRKAQWRR